MNEQKFLNGLKAAKSELTWNALFFGILYVAYLFLAPATPEKFQFVFWIALGCFFTRTVLSAFIDGYEKKI